MIVIVRILKMTIRLVGPTHDSVVTFGFSSCSSFGNNVRDEMESKAGGDGGVGFGFGRKLYCLWRLPVSSGGGLRKRV